MALNHPCGGLLDHLLRVDQIDDQPTLVADRSAQGPQAAVAHDFATSNDHDTLTQGLNIVHIMRCENYRHPIVAIEHFDKIAYRQLRDSIEANGRLIEKQEGRPMEERGCQITPHALPKGELANGDIEEVLKLQELDQACLILLKH